MTQAAAKIVMAAKDSRLTEVQPKEAAQYSAHWREPLQAEHGSYDKAVKDAQAQLATVRTKETFKLTTPSGPGTRRHEPFCNV